MRGLDLARAGNGGARMGAVVSCLIILAVIAAVTVVVAISGGAPTPLMHLYYIPILYASVSHGYRGAIASATVAGLAAGPWMPQPNAASGNQALSDWGVRLALFVVVALTAAWLARQDPRPLDIMLRDVVLGQGLRAAVAQRRVRVHYQPIVELQEGRVVGVEALCRWNDNRGRAVSPERFIPAAEKTGAIIPLGREVLRLATVQAVESAGTRGQGLLLSVNASAIQLSNPGFLGELADLVGPERRRPYRFCLEITETAIMSDPKTALLTLSGARDMGIAIALDDFGTGQSSMSYLAGFPIDIIKIDQSFVGSVDIDPISRALVRSMVSIAEELGAATIAEGVERPGQLRALRELGCDMAQGFYLGKPSDAEVVDWAQRALA